MNKVKITAVRKTEYSDLMEKYENPILHTCDVLIDQSWISENGQRPEGLCESAWGSMLEFVEDMAAGKGDFFDGIQGDVHRRGVEGHYGHPDGHLYVGTLEDGQKAPHGGDGGHAGTQGHHVFAHHQGLHCGEFRRKDSAGPDQVCEPIRGIGRAVVAVG